MVLYATAIVVDEAGRVLLVRRDDSRTWAPPGGALEVGETAAAAVVREVEEETGLKVMPVRLAGLYFLPERRTCRLVFQFRCLRRGGTLQTSTESPQVGYHAPDRLPWPMFRSHRLRIQQGLTQAQGTPVWSIQPTASILHWLRDALYAWRNLRRRLAGSSPVRTSPWQVEVAVAAQAASGAVLWQTSEKGYRLPNGTARPDEAPWLRAQSLLNQAGAGASTLNRLIAVYTKPNATALFLFGAAVPGAEIGSLQAPGLPLPALDAPAEHLAWAQAARRPVGPTRFETGRPTAT